MSEVKTIRIPPLGDVEQVDVIEVLVEPGDRIAKEDPMITLESDKASMEVPAPEGGVVKEVLVSVGDKVKEGDPILELEVEASQAREAAAPPERPESSVQASPVEEAASRAPVEEPKPPEQVPPAPEAAVASEPQPPAAEPPLTGAVPYATPAVRKFARKLGVDLSQVAGSGPKGRILREDVESFVKARLEGAPTGGIGAVPIPAVDFSKFGPVESQPLSRIKRRSGPHLQNAWLSAPQVTQHHEVDITELEDFRQTLRNEAERRGIKLTPLAFVLRVLPALLREFPTFNASLAPGGDSLILKRYYHIGVAVATPEGLVVPVIRDVDRKGVWEIAQALADVSERARAGKLTPNDLQGGCFSVSSLGGIGGGFFTPIVNVPEVAILGISRARTQPVWNGAEFVPRLMLPISLTYDHRVIDGAEGAQFVVRFAELLGDLRRLVL